MKAQRDADAEQSEGVPSHRATVLDERRHDDSAELARIRSLESVEVIDLRHRQSDWLADLTPPPSEELLTEPSRWVYFPWRRTLTGLLGPRAFRTLRLDRNRDKITADEQKRFENLKIGVVGLSVGHSIAHTLALEGLCGELRLADFDEIELTNLNRIPGSVLDLGVNKAIVAARRIAEIDPYLNLAVFPSGFNAEMSASFFDGLDVVVEECDSFEAKINVRIEAKARGIPVIMETDDRGMIDVERYDLEPTRPLFHGLLGAIDPTEVAGLPRDEAMPYFARLAELDKVSARMVASIDEIGRTLSSWPQLGSEIQLAGATVAAAVRRIGLGEPLRSGRVRIDLTEMLDQLDEPLIEAIS